MGLPETGVSFYCGNVFLVNGDLLLITTVHTIICFGNTLLKVQVITLNKVFSSGKEYGIPSWWRTVLQKLASKGIPLADKIFLLVSKFSHILSFREEIFITKISFFLLFFPPLGDELVTTLSLEKKMESWCLFSSCGVLLIIFSLLPSTRISSREEVNYLKSSFVLPNPACLIIFLWQRRSPPRLRKHCCRFAKWSIRTLQPATATSFYQVMGLKYQF